MTDWSDEVEARIVAGLGWDVYPSDADIRAALEEIERRGLHLEADGILLESLQVATERERDAARAKLAEFRATAEAAQERMRLELVRVDGLARERGEEVERLREALGRVLTEAGLQAHKHGCANKIARPAQWDARLPCAGCQAESALQGR